MIITLKDGSTKEYSEPKSIIEIAADISEGLARMACAGEVNGEVEDLRTVIDKDCNLSILTFNDEGGKAAFRHTTSHIMAQAIKRLYPETKLAIGPSIADGFYYDIDRETPLTSEDLEKIEAEMKKIVKELIRRNLDAGFTDLHMRLQVTRGFKAQTGMHPTLNVTNASIVICVDQKPPIFNKEGITLVTTWLKRYSPSYMDPKIHCCNQLNQIMAACEAIRQGADEAIMLDQNGYVAETNSTNLQMIKDGALILPTLDSQLPGITRKTMIQIAKEMGMEVQVRNVSVSEYYNADEVFICGTVGEVVPVKMIDGKKIGTQIPGPITEKFSQEYKKMTETLGVSIDD